MAEWLIRVVGKQRKEIDKDLLVQAILALGRQLSAEKQATHEQPRDNPPIAGAQEPAA